VDGCEVGHYHEKCLEPVYSTENLAANSIQFVGILWVNGKTNDCQCSETKCPATGRYRTP
jgi:hypothetical protein